MTTPERAEYMKAYAENNRERIREHKKKWADANPEKQAEAKARYRRENPEKKRAYREANKEKIRASLKANHAKHREERIVKMRAYAAANRRKIQARLILTKYGITPEVLQDMHDAQQDRCAICRTPFSIVKTNVDHCHATGVVRGLLCGECNRGLSCFKDKKKLFLSAIRYLDRCGE